MNKFHSGWYLIYTKPRHEKKLHAYLAERNINSFFPTRKILRSWHDRKKYVDEPLFPSYLFIYLNNMQSYYEGIDADGALYYVRVGKEIARVSESLVNDIKLIADRAGDIEICPNGFQRGERLVIAQGALTGLSCEIVEFNGKKRVLVRVDLLQRNILMTLPAEHLMAL